MYGAGNIGRGFIAQIFSQSGYEVCFIDVAEKIIEAINREGRYPVRILSDENTGGAGDFWIEGVSAIHGGNTEEAACAIAEADIMATAVGVRVLPLIAPVIAGGLQKRFAGGKDVRPLNIIICENLIDANKALEGYIKNYLSEEEQKIFDRSVGLVEASIGRMVPLQTEQMRDGNQLRVCVEAYRFLPVDKAAFKGDIPSLAGMRPFDNFDFYIKRKLYIHNMGHAICAYLGMLRGDTYIYETVHNGNILCIAQNAMLESALALSAKYSEPLSALQYHIQDLLRRFSNRALGDTCERVGADTKRKLGNRDRLAGSLICCREEGVSPAFISAGVAAALCRHLKENDMPQSRTAAGSVLREVSGFEDDTVWTDAILSFHSMFSSIGRDGNFDEATAQVITSALRLGHGPAIL